MNAIPLAVSMTIGLVQMFKQFPIPKNYLPILSLLIGAVIGYFAGVRGLDLLVVGLTASGAYDAGKATITEVRDRLP